MISHKIAILIAALFLSFHVQANSEIDLKLQDYISEFNLNVPIQNSEIIRPLFVLGQQLFHSQALSLANDISCAHCHNGMNGTGDGLPFSIGTGALGSIGSRVQGEAGVTRRHSPSLWNLGAEDVEFLFWDGRVGFHQNAHGQNYITSPSRFINGLDPLLSFITLNLVDALAVQSIFPVINSVEMTGEGYENYEEDILWEMITENVFNSSAADMPTLFRMAFPGVENYNIGHIALSLSHFQKHQFFVDDTPWDDYLRGDIYAMSEREKRGALLFMEKAQCIQCHSGNRFSDNSFHNILIADIGVGEAPNDRGRFEVTNDRRDSYAFLTPGLRNISLSPPYMHNGLFVTLEEVVEHYDHPMRTLMHYQTDLLNDRYGRFYNRPIVRSWDRDQIWEQRQTRSDNLPMRLFLTTQEKADLVTFMRESLTSKRWRNR